MYIFFIKVFIFNVYVGLYSIIKEFCFNFVVVYENIESKDNKVLSFKFFFFSNFIL